MQTMKLHAKFEAIWSSSFGVLAKNLKFDLFALSPLGNQTFSMATTILEDADYEVTPLYPI